MVLLLLLLLTTLLQPCSPGLDVPCVALALADVLDHLVVLALGVSQVVCARQVIELAALEMVLGLKGVWMTAGTAV